MALQINELSEVQFTAEDVTSYLKRSTLGDVMLKNYNFVTQERFESELEDLSGGTENTVSELTQKVTALETEVTSLEADMENIDGGTYS